ncbi:insulin gene enhancer protein ISL-3 isoform X2 [Arapaima gigas]
MRARDSSYHTRCFRCSVCGRQLVPGDEFTLRDKQLLCVADCVLLMDKPSSPPQFHCVGAPQMMGVLKQAERGTRVRTVLSEKQLLTLRTCYSVNPRPDALMKEQLVEMTGLHPRVIRVWFQNKRCKDKKKSILTKQQNHNNKTVGFSVNFF